MARETVQKFQSRYEIYISPLPASEPVSDILKMFEQVGAIQLKSSLEKIYCYRLLPVSRHKLASCRIKFCDSRAAREAISRFNGTALNGIKMKVSPVRGSYSYQPRSSTDWDCPSCQSLNFDHQASCFNCHRPRGTEERFAGSSRNQKDRDRGYQEREEGEERRNASSPAHHRRSGEDRDRGYQERREGQGRRPADGACHSNVRISKSPDVMRRDDKSSRGYSRDSRSTGVPERERRLSEHHQRPGEAREEERKPPGRRENHHSGSSGASKRSIESESPHRDFERDKSSGEKRLRRDDDQIQTDILNTIRRWFKGPISVDIQIKPGSPEGGEDEISLNLNINNKNNNKSRVIDGEPDSSFDEDKKLYREKIDLNKIKVEAKNQEDSSPNPPPKDAKAVKKRQKFDYEEDKKIVNMVLDKLDDNLLYSFDIPSQGLVKLSSELNREGKHIQSRWRYSIRVWIKDDQENNKEDWYNHGQAALDRRIQITRYFKIQTEIKRPKTVDKGQ